MDKPGRARNDAADGEVSAPSGAVPEGAPERVDEGLDAIWRMFRPRAVALVGVSGRANSHMARPLRYLRQHGYGGRIFPVNPNYPELEGLTCYPTLADVPEPVDLVLVMVPAAQAIETVRQAGKLGAAGAIVFASGFAETGPEGATLQAQLVEAGRAAGVRVLGPNCQGLLYIPDNLPATFTAAANRPLIGTSGVAYIGQSGAVGGSILDLATDMGLGLTAWASTGNQADLDLVEVCAALLEDPALRVFMLYVEGIGDGQAYTRLARRARELGKKLVVLRSGRSNAGKRAAASHTGSMLGNDAAFVLTSQAFGVTLVDDIDELLAVSAVLASGSGPAGVRLAVVTTSGGAGSLAADRCDDHGLALPELTAATQDRLRPLIPAFGALANPVDVTAQLFSRGEEAFGDVCRIIADDPNIDAVAVVVTMVVGEAGVRLAESLAATAAGLSKPLLICWLAGPEMTAEGRAVFKRAGRPIFGSVGGLARIASLVAPKAGGETAQQPGAPAPEIAQDRIRAAFAGNGGVDGRALLEAIGVAQPRSVLVTSATEAEAAAADIGAPVAMKLHADALAHKSDIGAVRLGVRREDAARVFDDLMAAAQRHRVPDAEGVLLQEMVPPGTELIIGATAGQDGFPPVITVGFGGVATEIHRDVSSALAPVEPQAAHAMLRSLRAWPLLDGFRGVPQSDIEAAVDAIVRVGHAAAIAGDRLAEMEINPLIVRKRGEGAVAVDVLVRGAGQGARS